MRAGGRGFRVAVAEGPFERVRLASMPEIYGNKAGLGPAAIKSLERLYRRRVPLARITSPELVRSLVDATRAASRQVGVLIHRSGQIDYVVVGDSNKLMLPDVGRLRAAEGRLRGLRLVHTHVFGEPLSRDDLVDLVRLRLDAVAAILLAPDGEPRGMSFAHVMPGAPGQEPYRVFEPTAIGRDDTDFAALVTSIETDFQRQARTRVVRAEHGRALLVHVALKKDAGALERGEASLRELRELARTAGVEVVDTVLQLRDAIDPKFVMGRGKMDDVVLRAAELDADVLVFDRDLSPSQASAIAKHTDLRVIDRSQLILDIFAARAESRDGKLQVELAQLKYSLPRLTMKDDALSRLAGGIGARRGPGETKLEIGKRRARERVTHLEEQLEKLGKQRVERRRRRKRLGVPVVAIVGYTNAGKSTLLNTLTDSDVLAEDKLFATLDTRSRRIRFPEEREVVLTDTVGFIRDLPKDLFAAFRATFEEAADADLLLHVIDAADPARDEHVRTTERLLALLELDRIPRILVFNKADLVAPAESENMLATHDGAVLLSATHRETTRALLSRIADELADRWKLAELAPPVDAVAALDDEPVATGDQVDTLEGMVGKRGAKRSRRDA